MDNYQLAINYHEFLVVDAKSHQQKIPINHHQPLWNHHFPMFSYGFPMVFLWLSRCFKPPRCRHRRTLVVRGLPREAAPGRGRDVGRPRPGAAVHRNWQRRRIAHQRLGKGWGIYIYYTYHIYIIIQYIYNILYIYHIYIYHIYIYPIIGSMVLVY